ncbi:nucleotidyltransferase [Anaeromicropila herbilytica]|uniref:tRNA(Met) cytidine acetate ligase n=1 Tax=Anaeromicropila herbilytica TaxID=2785025 RepID=A0A7R7EKR0_9FIRM|nr:nucleotidyltransferase [Anaeromicropila herbilytica]BCN30485.1 UPF0348 protein [Anaeromicropila herbilytica]
MKIVGLIAEYNPFHNGHKYHIEKAKELTNADYAVVIMSGNFVQRGTPAILDKYTRTEIALKNGADLVLELPICYSTASAEFFALGAISTLDKLGIIDSICFGSECGDIEVLTQIAELLINEPPKLSEFITNYMKTGITYPLARTKAIVEYLKMCDNNTFSYDITELEKLLLSPNNILGIEYIKAIKRLNSSIVPTTIKRKDSNFHDTELNNSFSSATAIRKAFRENLISTVYSSIPENSVQLLEDRYQKTFPILDNDLSLLLKYKLLFENTNTLTNYIDVSGGLENRISNLYNQYKDFQDFALLLKTKHLTLTRVTRALLHILLNIRIDTYGTIITSGTIKYARILGFRKESSHLIKSIKNMDQIVLITKMADAKSLLDETGSILLDLDVLATDLYNSIVYQKFGYEIKNDYLHEIVII